MSKTTILTGRLARVTWAFDENRDDDLLELIIRHPRKQSGWLRTGKVEITIECGGDTEDIGEVAD